MKINCKSLKKYCLFLLIINSGCMHTEELKKTSTSNVSTLNYETTSNGTIKTLIDSIKDFATPLVHMKDTAIDNLVVDWNRMNEVKAGTQSIQIHFLEKLKSNSDKNSDTNLGGIQKEILMLLGPMIANNFLDVDNITEQKEISKKVVHYLESIGYQNSFLIPVYMNYKAQPLLMYSDYTKHVEHRMPYKKWIQDVLKEAEDKQPDLFSIDTINLENNFEKLKNSIALFISTTNLNISDFTSETLKFFAKEFTACVIENKPILNLLKSKIETYITDSLKEMQHSSK